MKRIEIATQIAANLMNHETFAKAVNPYAVADEGPHEGLSQMMRGIAKLALAQADALIAEAFPTEERSADSGPKVTLKNIPSDSGSSTGWMR